MFTEFVKNYLAPYIFIQLCHHKAHDVGRIDTPFGSKSETKK